MKVLITGDSHTGPLKSGQNLLISKGEWPQRIDLTIRPLGNAKFFPTPFFVDKGDYAEIRNLTYRKQLERLPLLEIANSDTIYGLSGPLHTSRVLRNSAWSNFVPSQFALNEAPVSNALLHQTILDDCQYLLKLIDIIVRARKKLFVIEPPRPFKHNKSLKVIRPEVFSYVDGYYRDFIKQELKLRNIPIISVSPDCYDESGFMLECYRSPKEHDMHHGNAQFGELMMKKILDFLI